MRTERQTHTDIQTDGQRDRQVTTVIKCCCTLVGFHMLAPGCIYSRDGFTSPTSVRYLYKLLGMNLAPFVADYDDVSTSLMMPVLMCLSAACVFFSWNFLLAVHVS